MPEVLEKLLSYCKRISTVERICSYNRRLAAVRVHPYCCHTGALLLESDNASADPRSNQESNASAAAIFALDCRNYEHKAGVCGTFLSSSCKQRMPMCLRNMHS